MVKQWRIGSPRRDDGPTFCVHVRPSLPGSLAVCMQAVLDAQEARPVSDDGQYNAVVVKISLLRHSSPSNYVVFHPSRSLPRFVGQWHHYPHKNQGDDASTSYYR
jgi:hypothetical protein